MKTSITIFLSFAAISLLAQEKTFVREYSYNASDLDSKISCRTITINQLRSILLNEIGVYVESESILKTSDVSDKFSQDFVENIATISAGITKLEVLDETWNGQTFWMKASITIDRESIEESLKQLVKDRQKVKELEAVKIQLIATTEELNNLKKKITNESKQNEESTSKELNKQYNDAIETLDAANYVLSGYEKLFREDYKGAMADFNKVIEIDPNNASGYIGRGLTKYKLQNYRGEIEDYTKAIEIDPNNSITFYNRAVARNALQDYEGAISDGDKAIKLDPQDGKAYYNRGVAKAELRDDRGAIIDYTKAIEIDPKLAEPYFNRGNLKENLSDKRGAMDDFSKAIKLNPKYASAYNNRGLLKLSYEDYRGALADFNKTIEIDPNHANAYYNRGIAKYNLGQKHSACLDFSKAGELGFIGAYETINENCK